MKKGGSVMKKVKCKNNSGMEKFLTLNKKYEIKYENEDFYEVIGDDGVINMFLKWRFEEFNNDKDKEHLEFIYNRLIHKYDENENCDYMLKFKEIIDRI